MVTPARFDVLGVGVDAVQYGGVVDRIAAAAHSGAECKVAALAVHGLMEAVDDPAFRARISTFDLVCPDGQPVRWATNLLHRTGLPDRVYGPELMRLLCAKAAAEQLEVFLYGTDGATLSQLVSALEQDYPSIRIVGTLPSRFGRVTPEEHREIAETIKSTGAKICFVGLGCPRQEVFAYEISGQLEMPVVAVGAAFRYLAGLDVEPPSWVQRAGLQWLYRLLRDPVRLWRRYLILNPRFVLAVLMQRFARRRSATSSCTRPGFEGWA